MKKQKLKKTSLFFTLAMMAAGLFIAALAVAQDKDAKTKAALTAQDSAAKDKPQSVTRQDQWPKASGAMRVQPYKDPEDMTSRSKPANATTNIPPTPTTGDRADAKKHLAGVKYEDRQVSSSQTLDGASKDAAKSNAAPANTGSEVQGASNRQDGERAK